MHQGGGFGGVNVSYNYLAKGRVAEAHAQQLELHTAVRAAASAPRLADWFAALQVWMYKRSHVPVSFTTLPAFKMGTSSRTTRVFALKLTTLTRLEAHLQTIGLHDQRELIELRIFRFQGQGGIGHTCL